MPVVAYRVSQLIVSFHGAQAVDVRKMHWYGHYRHTVFNMVQSCFEDDGASGPLELCPVGVFAFVSHSFLGQALSSSVFNQPWRML